MTTARHSIAQSFFRCQTWILSIFAVYLLSCLLGLTMVHLGNKFALNYRDRIVGKALIQDQASTNFLAGNNLKAALTDFGENVLVGALVQSALGLTIALPFITCSYQGWIGGIVTVDGKHKSRLVTWRHALYFWIVFLSQTIAYSLCIGAGLKLGIETYKKNKKTSLLSYRLDKQSLADQLTLFIIAIPIFLAASCFEFMSSWN